jgi:anthranilate synthase component 2
MILVIDNYDSFTWNLVQYLGELGAEVVVRRNDAVTVEEIGTLRPDAIVLSPGPCAPAQAGVTVEAIRRWGPHIPMLGVCLGHQAIGQVFGGRVVRAAEVMHGKTSVIHHDDAGVFAGLPQPFEATRYHSLVVDPASVPDELVVTARVGPLSDPDGVIMGLRHREHAVEGVQFHPESILTGVGHQLLQRFLDQLVPAA